MLRKSLALAIAALVCGLPLSAVSQQKDKISDGVVKVGLILDMASLYSDITGEGMVHDMYLFEVKSPQESKSPWDYYKLRATIPAAEAFQPLSKSACPLVKK